MIHGLHHVALSTADMGRALRFYCGVLGLRLVGIFPMHGVPDAIHAFCDMGDGRLLSFIRFADPPPAQDGVTRVPHPGVATAVGTMQHIALNVADPAALDAMRARMRAAGLQVSPPIPHGFCQSIYTVGPDGEQLEVSCFLRPLDESEMDADTAAACGIDAATLAALQEGRA